MKHLAFPILLAILIGCEDNSIQSQNGNAILFITNKTEYDIGDRDLPNYFQLRLVNFTDSTIVEWYPIESVKMLDSNGVWKVSGYVELSPQGPIGAKSSIEYDFKGYLTAFNKPGRYIIKSMVVFDTSSSNPRWRYIESNEFTLSDNQLFVPPNQSLKPTRKPPAL